MILACNNVSKAFGTDIVLSGVSFHINEQEKAAVIGGNGAGKSTLLKIIVGELKADEGETVLAKGASLGYLAQHQGLLGDRSIYDEVLSVKEDVVRLDERIRQMERDMKGAKGESLETLLKSYTNLTHEFELKNGYALQSEITGVLKGLGFAEQDFSKKVDTLSGGQKTRVALGKLLLSSPDIILLDEPTNHLDLNSIAWLETYLTNYKGAVVLVAHDRYFLDKIVTKVIGLENNCSQTYLGNYSAFAEKREAQRDAALKLYYNQQKEIRHHEEVIAKLKSYNREKTVKRAESREKLLDKMERVDKPVTENAKMFIRLEPRVISGNDVLTVTGLSKSFGSLSLFQNIDFQIKRGEKTAVIGNNGTGKTTLLKIINGMLPADCGEIVLGSKVKIGYYDQEQQVLDMDKTLFSELQDAYPGMDNTAVRNVLASFLFTNDDVFKRIKDLSGGERGRVSLAKLMLSEANLLILDEPTNHLDIVSKEILENAVNQYSGTVLYVSHDRYFINKTATRILDLSDKQFFNYIGNYDYYLEKKEEVEAAYKKQISFEDSGQAMELSFSDSDGKSTWQQQKEEQARLRKQQNDLKKCEDEINHLEERNEEIDLLLTREDIYTNAAELTKLNQEKIELEKRLEALLHLWESLA